MNVVLAQELGMCFGVRDALRHAAEIKTPQDTTIYGELVHNPVVLHELDTRGFHQMRETCRQDQPQTRNVLVTAHGISDYSRNRLAASHQLIDTTCPLVRRVHEAAKQLQREGFHVLVLGTPGHVEVQGIVEDLHSYNVLSRPPHVCRFSHERIGIVCQSTFPPQLAETMVSSIRRCNPQAEIRFIDTICDPTRRRQQAAIRLCERVQAVVVVGGRNSNNTLQLVELCRQHQVPVLHVESAADLNANWLRTFETVGLTAGTSTLDSTIAEVYEALTGSPPPAFGT